MVADTGDYSASGNIVPISTELIDVANTDYSIEKKGMPAGCIYGRIAIDKTINGLCYCNLRKEVIMDHTWKDATIEVSCIGFQISKEMAMIYFNMIHVHNSF